MAGETKKITDNFAYQNSMRFLGLSAITYGLVSVDDHDDYQVYVSKDKNNYQKCQYWQEFQGVISNLIY